MVEKLGVCYIFSAKNEKRTIAVIYDIHFLGSASVCVKVGLEITSHALLWFLKEKSFDSIAIVFFFEWIGVRVTAGLEVDNVLLMD